MARYKDMIFSQAYYFTRSHEDAADITQEVLLKTWSCFNTLEQRGIRRWLLKVTQNKCIDHSRRQREPVMSDISNSVGSSTCLLEPVDGSPNPEQKALERDLRDRLELAIRQLPPKIRTAVIMREIHLYSYEDISRAMEVPLNTVKVYLHRGRKMLFEHFRKIEK